MSQPDSTSQHEGLRKIWFGISTAVITVVLFVAIVLVKPAMPDRIILLTGPEGSTYHHLGTQYAENLRRRGLNVEVTITAGALDNLRRLAPGENAVAFAPSTTDHWVDSGIDFSQLVALGSVGVEPLWLFFRSGIDIVRIPDLAGRNVATGGAGTVSDSLARTLIANNNLDDVEFQSFAGQPLDVLVEDIATGTVDAVFVTGNARSPIVKALLDANGVSFLSFDRAEAYATLIPGVTELVVPEGIIDLVRNVPPQDAHLLSAASCLVAHKDLNHAVVPMILVAAETVERTQSVFSKTLTFPSSEHLTLPLAPAARRYFNQGETGLSKFLPYNVTRYLNHLGYLVLPLLTGVVILLRIIPAGLRIWWGIRLKRLLLQLEAVEKGNAAGTERSKLLADLDRIDRASATMSVPRSAVHDYIGLRQFLHDMRERVET